jgi:hypothetical protein
MANAPFYANFERTQSDWTAQTREGSYPPKSATLPIFRLIALKERRAMADPPNEEHLKSFKSGESPEFR